MEHRCKHLLFIVGKGYEPLGESSDLFRMLVLRVDENASTVGKVLT